MNRIMVIGVSAGVGKSTFARELGKILDINVYYLDKLYWKPNWIEASTDEFREDQQDIVTLEKWIIEGNYSSTFDIRLPHTDTIIYLELPLYICLYRVFKRWIMNFGKTRIDMGEDCKEKLDYAFLKYIWTTYSRRKKSMAARFKSIQESDSSIKIITLKGKKEIKSYLQTGRM